MRAKQCCDTQDAGWGREQQIPQCPTPTPESYSLPCELPEGQGFYKRSVWEFVVAIRITNNFSSNGCRAQVRIYWPEGLSEGVGSHQCKYILLPASTYLAFALAGRK